MSHWKFRDRASDEPPASWARKLSITPLLLDLLWSRGLRCLESMEDFLSPRLSGLTNPKDWPQIPKAAEIIANELLDGKKLAIWGDYDVDGITATTLALDVLHAHGFKPVHHLPDRRKEGYGLNIPEVEKLARLGCQTMLTVDCGISSVEAVARANELGMTVVVTDHHLPPEKLPEAACIVNPRMVDAGNWPCPHLAGVGVAFYLLAAINGLLARHTGKRYRMDDALDLVALGTLADVMRLEGENRILASGGLRKLGKPARPGMAALKKVSGFDLGADVSSGQAVFRLAPRINAAGRMGSADLVLGLLMAKDQLEAETLARQLDDCNSERKQQEEKITNEARTQALELLEMKNQGALVLYGPDWHPGIVGIVASRIVEEFHRPAIVLCDDNGSLKGSGRTVSGFNLYEGLKETSSFLLGFGGHRQAAGLRLEKEQLENFRNAFSDLVLRKLGDRPVEPVIILERELDFLHASDHVFLRELQLMQPFGPGNPEPVFASPLLTVERQSFFGRENEHVMLKLKDEKSKITLTAKAWRMAGKFPLIGPDQKIRIAYTPKLDLYNGMPNIDIGIKDWRVVSN